jgi:hypothetical protein
VTDKENEKTLYFFVLTKESLRVYILLALSEVREWKKISCKSTLYRETSRNINYIEEEFVVSNATRRPDSFFTNGTSSDTIASDPLYYEPLVQCFTFSNLNARHVDCGNGVQ